MYNYPSMNVRTLANQEKLLREQKERANVNYYINKTELNTVKTLFQLRNAHYYKKSVMPVQLSDYSTDIYPKERVFIAGKIFPFINIVFTYANVKDIKQIIKPIYTQLVDDASRIRYYDSKVHNSKYISINNNKIAILLPKNYGDISFPQLMFDFLTNKSSVEKYIGGEFPDYDTYRLALRDRAYSLEKWKGQDGSWLTSDRDSNSDRWRTGYSYIIQHKIKGRMAPFAQIYKFYDSVDWYLTNVYKHEVKWCKGAKALVKALNILDGGFWAISNDVETILNELNLGICDFAIEKFYDLIYGKYAKTPLKGDAAYEWDKAFIEHEQGIVAPPIYKKTSSLTISKFQDMADKDIQGGWHGSGSQAISRWKENDIVPAFDDFKPEAKVTDDQFRIDLPLLMLYLYKHKPKWGGFKDKLNPDGTVNDEIVKIIKPYEK